MNVKQIEYKKLINTGNFEHQSLSVTVELEDGETAHDAVKRAKAFVDNELQKRPEPSEWDSAKRILLNPDNYTGRQVKEAQKIVELCEQPEEIPF